MAKSILYNEIKPYSIEYLRRLMVAGVIADGDIADCSIEDLKPHDVAQYRQFHAFAGVGVWSYALREIGWPDDAPIWTGSCPCQPFSAAGQGHGFADERHLWPAFFHLITTCGPERVAGEQVSDKGGPAWLDLVQADMEGAGFAFRGVGLCSAGFGGPDRRHRFYWMADTNASERGPDGAGGYDRNGSQAGWVENAGYAEGRGHAGGLADTDGREPGDGDPQRGGEHRQQPQDGGARIERHGLPGPVNGFWRAADWLLCRDPGGPRWRPVEPGSFPLAHGITGRMGRLSAYGDAINAQVAINFLEEALSDD